MHGDEYGHGEVFKSKGEQRIIFFLVFIGVISITYGIFVMLDFVPEEPGTIEDSIEVDTLTTDTEVSEVTPITENTESDSRETPQPVEEVAAEPISIIFDSLDREVVVKNPLSREEHDLDAELLNGVVRHPDSADFVNEGTIFLFGHSSYLPNVFNKNYQAFNGIQDLSWGDTIRLRSADMEYVYRVDRVYDVKATEAEVEIERGKPKLTLATCDVFGSKEDRHIVEASLIESYSL